MMRFDGQVALVTGATAGIGQAAAMAFARAGASVVISGRRAPEGEETAHRIAAEGGHATFIAADVRRKSEVERLVDRTVSLYGRLDCAFNNAGTISLSALTEENDAHLAAVVETNLNGVYACMKHEIRQMRRFGGGSIVNTSSLAGLRGARERSLYAASKHAVIGLTKSVALEVAADNIRVNAVCPGAIEGAMDDLFMRHFHLTREALTASVPLRRAGRPQDVAGAVLFLCSGEASFITGAVLSVDGGLSAG